jgi:hypothetical protein
MKLLFPVLFLLVVTSATPVATANAQTVHCGSPGQTIKAALASGATKIGVSGTCTESLSITHDNVTLQGNLKSGAVVVGDIVIRGARNVTINNLTVTGAEYGIEVIFGSTATISNTTVKGTTRKAIAVQAGIATLDHVTVQDNALGIDAAGGSHIEVINHSLIQNNSGIGINIQSGASGVIRDSTIKNNKVGTPHPAGGGITFFDAGGEITNNVISGNAVSEVLLLGSTVALVGNAITASRSTDSALEVDGRSLANMSGGNTISNTASGGFALLVGQNSTLVQLQRLGHDIIKGKVDIFTAASAIFSDLEIRGTVLIEERSLVDIYNNSANPLMVAIAGDTTLSRGSSLHLLLGAHVIRIIGNIMCADSESKFVRGGAKVEGDTSTCRSY